MTSQKTNWQYGVLIFVIGLSVGILLGQWTSPYKFYKHGKHGGMKNYMLEKFNRELSLNAEQKEKTKVIFDAQKPKMLAIHQEMRPKFEAVKAETQSQIREFLNEEQLKKLEELNVRMEERWKEKEKYLSS